MISRKPRRLRLLGAVVAALAFAGAGPAQAADTATVPDTSAVLVELLGNAKFVGFPAVCPGTLPEDNQDEVICLAELYEVPVRVIRPLGGVRTAKRLTIRFTAHSFHAVWRKHSRFLLDIVPFEDKGRRGHFAWYWDWPDDNGRFCQDSGSVENIRSEPIRKLYLTRRAQIVPRDSDDWSKGSAIHCVTGFERMK